MTVEVCPICDIAGCKHIRERTHPMTHDTPPKRIWVVYGRVYDRKPETPGLAAATEYTLTSEADAMVAAVVREAAAHGDAWIAVFGDVEIKHTPANAYAADAVLDYQDAILALTPQPASAALDKLIAEAVAAATPTMQRAARVLHDEAMAAAYLGENVTEDEAAMLQFIDALGGKTKVINALHALATATKGATP